MIVGGMGHMVLGMDRVLPCASICNVLASSNANIHAPSHSETIGYRYPTNAKLCLASVLITDRKPNSTPYTQPRGRYLRSAISSRNRGWNAVPWFGNKGATARRHAFHDMRTMCSSYAEGETTDVDEASAVDVDNGSTGTTVRLNGRTPTSEQVATAELESADEKLAVAEKALLEAQEALQVVTAKAASLEEEIQRVSTEARQELAAARASYEEQLANLLKEKEDVGNQLDEARDEALDLAVKVEKMAEIAVQEATARIAEEAQLQIAAAQTAAADATLEVEERIRKAADEAAASVINEAKATIEEALKSADMAKQQAKMAEESLRNRMQAIDELAKAEVAAMAAEEAVAAMERQLRTVQGEVERLTGQLLASEKRAEMAEAQVLAAEASVVEIQKAADKHALEREERTQRALEAIRSAAQAKEEAAFVSYNAETEQLRAVAEAAAKGEIVKERALIRRCVALERSLAAAEISKKAWEDRALAVENLLRMVKEKGFDVLREAGDVNDILCNGRLETTLGTQKRKWDLLANGPRHLHPWASIRRSPGGIPIPPRKTTEITAELEEGLALQLPKPEDVLNFSRFNIAKFGPVVKEEVKLTTIETVVEEKVLEEQRESLEKTLQKVHKEVKQRPWLVRQKPPDNSEDKWESGTGNGKEIVFQGFNWESWRRKWYLEIAPKAADMAKSGITTIWLPPPTQSVAPQGYMPSDLYNLNCAYGTEEELRFCIDEMHAHGIQVLGDVVLNHRCAQKQSPNGVWNIFGGKMAWGPEAIVRDDPNFQGRGNPSSGDIFHAAPNIDHAQDFVRRDIKEWLQWLRTDIGYDGWRLDFVRGFWGGYVKEYIEASKPNFAIGEYWDSLAYDGGQVSYNQDAHRQRIINWVNATGGTSSAFDVTTKGILHSALHNEYWRLIDPQGKPPGVMGWWPSRAITFLENHDTGSTQGHWPFPRDKIEQGYAYILTHPGTPVIFYDHFYDFGLHDAISDLIAARTRTGVHCRSPVRIFHATAEGYVAQCGDNLVIKMGHIDWNPSKQINLVGRWEKFCDKGSDYQLWERR